MVSVNSESCIGNEFVGLDISKKDFILTEDLLFEHKYEQMFVLICFHF